MKITQYSMLSSFRTVPVFGQIVFKAYFLRVAIATNLIIWDSDDSPSFNELLLCTFVRFVLFVTKQKIFEKCESNWVFFKKYVIYRDRKYTPLLWKPVFQNLKSELRSFCVKKATKSFFKLWKFFPPFFKTFKAK